MNSACSHPSKFNRLLAQCLTVGSLTGLSLLLGWVPRISTSNLAIAFDSAAVAQSAGNAEITNYAKAVLAMEPLRQSAYNEIKKLVNQVPNIICSQPSSFSSLPGNARKIAADYCQESKAIVEANNLTIEQFNRITRNQQQDTQLRERIQAELIRLQANKQ